MDRRGQSIMTTDTFPKVANSHRESSARQK